MTRDRRDQHARDVQRNEHARQLLALRGLESRAQAEVRQLERRLRELGERHDRTARCLESEYRRTHFGRSPASAGRATRPSAEHALWRATNLQAKGKP